MCGVFRFHVNEKRLIMGSERAGMHTRLRIRISESVFLAHAVLRRGVTAVSSTEVNEVSKLHVSTCDVFHTNVPRLLSVQDNINTFAGHATLIFVSHPISSSCF